MAIRHFTSEPNVICQGTPVRLSWDATGSGALSAQPPDSSLGSVNKAGERIVRPAATTLYRLEVHQWSGGRAARDNTVEVRNAPREPKLLAVSLDDAATCDGKRFTATVDPEAKWWDSGLSAAEVARIGDRALHVEHAGRAADLQSDDFSSAFAGAPVQGPWVFSIALQPGEACSSDSIPNSLALNVRMRCDLRVATKAAP